MKKFYLLSVLGVTLYHCSSGQNPKLDTRKKLNAFDSSQKKQVVDSIKYIPQRVGWTNDFVHLFSKQETESLDSLIDTYEKKTTVEFLVATIDTSMMGRIDFEPYTSLMLRTWTIGKREKNNGILIIIAKDLRRMQIQNGYGFVKALTGEQTQAIIDETIIPYFKAGKFFQGTKEGILAIINKLEKNGL